MVEKNNIGVHKPQKPQLINQEISSAQQTHPFLIEPDFSYTKNELIALGLPINLVQEILAEAPHTNELQQLTEETESYFDFPQLNYQWFDTLCTRMLGLRAIRSQLNDVALAAVQDWLNILPLSWLEPAPENRFTWLFTCPQEDFIAWTQQSECNLLLVKYLSEWIDLECSNLETFVNRRLVRNECFQNAWLNKQLSRLNNREQEIIVHRYGLKLNRQKTLQELAEIFGVTRERIRQCEKKALRLFSEGKRGELARIYLDSMEDFIWAAIAPRGACRKLDANKLPYLSALLIDIASYPATGLRSWAKHIIYQCASCSHRMSRSTPKCSSCKKVTEKKTSINERAKKIPNMGWVHRDLYDAVLQYKWVLGVYAKNSPLAINDLLQKIPADINLRTLKAIITLSKSHKLVEGNYVIKGKNSSKRQTEIMINKYLRNSFRPIHALQIQSHLNNLQSEKKISIRDVKRFLKKEHLQLHLFNDFWIPIEPNSYPLINVLEGLGPNSLTIAQLKGYGPSCAPEEEEDSWLYWALQSLTNSPVPLRPKQIYKSMDSKCKNHPTQNEMLWYLVTNGHILRFAPGIYGTAKHLDSKSTPSLLFPRALRQYVLARYAGETEGLYPCWTVEMEDLWFEWITDEIKAKPRPFMQRLFIAFAEVAQSDRPLHWLCEQTGRSVQDLRSSFHESTFNITQRPHLKNAPLAALELFRVLLWVHIRGQVNWVQANLACGESIERGKGQCLVHLLADLRLITPTGHRQDYGPTEKIPALLEIAFKDLSQDGELTWESPTGQELQSMIHQQLELEDNDADAYIELSEFAQSLKNRKLWEATELAHDHENEEETDLEDSTSSVPEETSKHSSGNLVEDLVNDLWDQIGF